MRVVKASVISSVKGFAVVFGFHSGSMSVTKWVDEPILISVRARSIAFAGSACVRRNPTVPRSRWRPWRSRSASFAAA